MTEIKTDLTLAWFLAERSQTASRVVLTFHRADWWESEGDDVDAPSHPVEPGTPGAGTYAEAANGTMVLTLTPAEAEAYAHLEPGRQYAFRSDLEPLYEGE